MAEITIKVNGKDYGFKFTDLTLIEYCRQREVDFSDMQDDLTKNVLQSNNVMFRCAYWVFHRGKKEMSEFEMDDVISAMPQEDYEAINKSYIGSITSMVARLNPSPKDSTKKK